MSNCTLQPLCPWGSVEAQPKHIYIYIDTRSPTDNSVTNGKQDLKEIRKYVVSFLSPIESHPKGVLNFGSTSQKREPALNIAFNNGSHHELQKHHSLGASQYTCLPHTCFLCLSHFRVCLKGDQRTPTHFEGTAILRLSSVGIELTIGQSWSKA